MRISLTDLFHLTAIVAAYLGGWATTFGEIDTPNSYDTAPFLVIVGMPTLIGLSYGWQRRQCGSELLSLWKPARWLVAWCFIPWFLATDVLFSFIGHTLLTQNLLILNHGLLLILIGILLLQKRVVLAERGVLVDFECVPWTTSGFDLVHAGEASHLLIPHLVTLNKGPRRHVSAPVPAEDIEQVHAILAAKRKEEPPITRMGPDKIIRAVCLIRSSILFFRRVESYTCNSPYATYCGAALLPRDMRMRSPSPSGRELT